ncbi:MAG: hypothetical protein ISS15_04200 [Alphaproteobacteria bacterium]|jgi:hypothetical protein|nr:hypothetical protein [Alphaproteobacteria bacterium]MBL6940253.1 hypothetical protein [Alphaproteobacteria bacterium]MBL7096839.1 hypothetical protein [Alphaproteobacteria bacterium]
MDALTISLRGMETASAQFAQAAAATVRDSLPVAAAGSAGPVSTGDLNSDVVGQMMAMLSYRANLRAWQAANRMTRATIDLIG